MPNLKQLSRKHPSHCGETWQVQQALYRGGPELQAQARKLLPQLSSESPRQYQDRLSQALTSYEPHVSTCIDTTRNQLFTSPFQLQSLDSVPLPDFYSDFQESASAQGAALDSFFRDRFTQALIFGRSFWLVQAPTSLQDLPLSKAEWLDQGLDRCWLQALTLPQILNWELDSRGDLLWVVIHDSRPVQADPFDPEPQTQETWTVYTRESLSTYQLTYSPKQCPKAETLIPLVSQAAHSFGQVPLLCLDLESQDLALMPKAQATQVHHWALATGLSLATVRTCIPQTIIKTDSLENISKQGDYGTVIGAKDEISLLLPSSDSFDFQLSRLSSLQDQIYNLCHLPRIKEPTERARSGYAKEIDTTLTEVALKSYGIAVREALERTLTLITAHRGEALRFDVTGLDSFSISIRGMTIEAAQALLALDLPESFQREIKKLLRQKVLPGLSQPIATEVDSDITNQASHPTSAPSEVSQASIVSVN